jgi:integrase
VTDDPIENDKKAWHWVREKAGLPQVTFHGLRHTLGTWQGQAGVNQKMIADTFGHRSTATTDRYVHSDPDIWRQSMVLAIPADFDVVDEHQKTNGSP